MTFFLRGERERERERERGGAEGKMGKQHHEGQEWSSLRKHTLGD